MEVFTGTGIRHHGDSTYTGDLVDGMPQEQGSILWDDGGRYDGTWEYGTFIG